MSLRVNHQLESIATREAVLNDLVKGQVTSDDLHTSLVTKDGLLDSLIVLYKECCQENLMKNKHVSAFVRKYGGTIEQIKKLRIKVGDFEVKDVIGRGHFGEVQVVRERVTGTVFAMKILHKHETLAQHEISFYEEERDIMAKASSPWITQLHYAFQDPQNLYLIMEFHGGGDLLSLLSRHDDIFEESMARFYVAEMTLAIHALHSMGYVHRDIKPENILIDIHGHVKLADFGSSAKLSPDGLVASRMPVGTPDYVSPELLTSMDKDYVRQNYGVEVDWWSLGVCMYEMLYGKTPFTDENGSMCITYANIMNFKNCLIFPSTITVSAPAISLIRNLLTDKNHRHGYEEIRKHHFFESLNLDNIRSETPPFIPHLASLDDTSNFEEFERIKYQPMFDEYNTSKDFSGKDLPFVGFTYIRSKDTQTKVPRLSLLKEEVKEDSITDTSSDDIVTTETSGRNLEVKLTVKINELQNKYHELEESECSVRSEVERMQLEGKEKEERITALTVEKEGLEKELEMYISKCKTLTSQLDTTTAERDQLELRATKMYQEISDMTKEAQNIEEEILRCEVDELQDYVKELETELQSLKNIVKQRDKQLNDTRELYADNKKQLTQLKKRLDKERRKSRDDQKRDFALLENREEMWKTQMHDKCVESADKERKIQELQDLIEAYEEQEKEYMEREQKLLKRIEQGKSSDKLDIRVLLQTGPSPKKRRDSLYEQRKNRIQELEDLVEKYEADSKAWQEEEDSYQELIDKLRTEVEAYKHQQKMSIQTKENLKQQVEIYQEEVSTLRKKIKELQENVKVCLEEKDHDNKHAYMEKHAKELEVEVELLREDKRKAFKEKIDRNQELDELKHKVAETERTINRLTSRLERTERQLSQSRDREIEVRLKAREGQEVRNKLQEAQIQELRKENSDLENKLKSIKFELEELKSNQAGSEAQKEEIKRVKDEMKKETEKQISMQEKINKAVNEKLDLRQKILKLETENEGLHESLKCCKEEIEKLDESLKNFLELEEEHTKMRDENDQLTTKVSDLEAELHKFKDYEKVKEEKNHLQIKLQNVEKELEELKILSAKRWNKLDNAEDLRQENKFLESKLKSQQSQKEELELKIKGLEEQQRTIEQKDKKIKSLSEELDQVRLRRRSAEVRVQELQREMDQKVQQPVEAKGTLEDRLQAEREKNEGYLEDLRKELKEYNVALSEAKSLLAAQQRLEQSMREQHEAEVRELKMKLYRAQGKGDVEDDIKLVKSQNETLSQQIKTLEGKITQLLKEKGEISMERQTLKDKIIQLEHSSDLDKQKVELLQNSCGELERQIQDLEALIEENEKKEKEWENIRKTYETAVDEREEEIEGTSQRVQALEQARQSASERYDKLKQQLQAEKSRHKTEVGTLNDKLWEAKQIASTAASKMLDLESQVAKLQMMYETQGRSLEVDVDEKTKLKEEISSVITENQSLRSKNLKLKQSLDEAMDKFELIFGEKVDLENFAEALQGLHFLERYKFESTIGQQMKLIDYLKVLYEENNDKKKKGKKGSKGQLPGPAFPGLTDLQNALELERKRNVKLTEQLDRLRQENLAQAQELLHLKGPLKERMDGTMSANVKAEVAALTRTPSTYPTNALLTPRANRSQKFLMQDMPPTPQRMHHAIPHKLKMGLNTRATKCGVCLGSIPFVRQASKCQMCHMTYHHKCVPEVPDNCGLPTEYVHYFSEIMTKLVLQPQKYSLVDGSSPLKLKGWLKIQRAGKPRWEKRWAVLENNILMLYRDESDANPVDTFDLNPPETDVGIHSAISVAELSSTAQSDLPYVIKLEHVPLTTCWSGRVLYLMALSFTDKQKWVAYLEAAVKSLQRTDTTFKRTKLEQHKLLELSGDRRLELNCTLVLTKQILLLGADEGLYGVNIHNGKHAIITRLTGLHGIHHMVYAESISSVLIITGKDRHVLYVHRDAIKTRLNQATCDETTKVPYTLIESLPGCTVLEVTENREGLYVVGGLADRVVVLKYNTELREFCVRKEFMTTEPCSCLCVTEEFAVIGTDKFYKIGLDHQTMAEFVDKKDNSLGFAAYGAAKRMSFPLAVVNVSPKGCPLEFLLCFHEFGVFVDSKGRRSRAEDMKWSCLPLSFGYSEPFLYVTYFNSVQAITIPADKNETRGKQTCLDIHFPRYLGNAMTSGGVYIADNRSHGTDLVCLRGNDGLPGGELPGAKVENKENQPKYATDSPAKWMSPRGGPLRSSKMRRDLSLTSIDSNSTVASGCTISSTSSGTSGTTMESDF